MPSLPSVNVSEVVNATAGATNTGLGVLHDVATGVTGLVPAGFTFGFEHLMQLLIIHFIFILIFHKFFGIFKGIIGAAIISFLLPVILVKMLGFAIPLTFQTFATFMIFGIAIYVVLAVFWKLAFRKPKLGRGG